MRNILLYPHGGSGNHGCEAIVRSTKRILGENMILFSDNVDQDLHYGLNSVCEIVPLKAEFKKDLGFLSAAFKYYLLSDKYAYDKLVFRNLLSNASNADIALSIGGDNYCYGTPRHIMLINEELRKKKVPLVLWGCSIEPSAINIDILNDLRNYSLIVARESITYSALRGASLNNVCLAPDPAFLLPITEVSLPKWWKEDDTVGINISPLIKQYSSDKDMLFESCKNLIEYILDSTESQIALIPHVVWTGNDDRESLKLLYDKYKNSGRIGLVGDELNAEQLKFIISKCRVLVAARTHASIAAYSTGVPVIVLGYSVKSHGIAYDILGERNNYVIDVKDISEINQITKLYINLMKNESNIRNTIKETTKTYGHQLMSLKSKIEKCL